MSINITSDNPVNEFQETLDGLLRFVRVQQLGHFRETKERIDAYVIVLEATEQWMVKNINHKCLMDVLRFRTNVIGAHSTHCQILRNLKHGIPSHGYEIENNLIHQQNENKLKR